MNRYASPAGHQQSKSMSQMWLRSNHYQQKISKHFMCIILNSTIKWAGPCIGSYRSMETPPELVVSCENVVNNSTSQCQSPTVLWSVLQGKGHSPPWSEKPVCWGLTHQVLSYACCFSLKQGLVLNDWFLYFHLCKACRSWDTSSVLQLRAGNKTGGDLLCNAKASLNLSPDLWMVMLFIARQRTLSLHRIVWVERDL